MSLEYDKTLLELIRKNTETTEYLSRATIDVARSIERIRKPGYTAVCAVLLFAGGIGTGYYCASKLTDPTIYYVEAECPKSSP